MSDALNRTPYGARFAVFADQLVQDGDPSPVADLHAFSEDGALAMLAAIHAVSVWRLPVITFGAGEARGFTVSAWYGAELAAALAAAEAATGLPLQAFRLQDNAAVTVRWAFVPR